MKTNLKRAHPLVTREELARQWLECKRAEAAARDKRLDVEAQILALLPAREEGTQRHTLDDGLQIIIEGRLTRTVDAARLKSDWTKLCPAVQAAFNWKPEVSVSAWRQLGNEDAQQAARYVTTKPAKPGVKVEG